MKVNWIKTSFYFMLFSAFLALVVPTCYLVNQVSEHKVIVNNLRKLKFEQYCEYEKGLVKLFFIDIETQEYIGFYIESFCLDGIADFEKNKGKTYTINEKITYKNDKIEKIEYENFQLQFCY